MRSLHHPFVRVLAGLALVLTASCVGAAAAPQDQTPPAGEPASGSSHLAAIQERGSLVVVSFPHQESHFIQLDLSKGPMTELASGDHYLGIDVDIMQRFAESLGVDLMVRRVSEPSYGALIPDLLAGQGDLIASSLSITEKRQQKVDFSVPYYTVFPVIVTKKGSEIDEIADLAGRPVSVIPGSSHEEHLLKLGLAEESFVPTGFMQENYLAVDEGDAEFTLVDSGSAERVLPHFRDLEVAFRLEGEDSYGYAFPPGSDLRPVLNEFLEELRASGELDEIIAAHEPGA